MAPPTHRPRLPAVLRRRRGRGWQGVPAGFTLVELVIVILLLGVLSFAALPRLAERDDALAQGFAEQVASTLRWAQKSAVAQRRLVYVNIDASAGRVRACFDAAPSCTQPLAAPASGTLDVTAPARIALTSGLAQFSFAGLGRPSINANLELRAATAAGQSFAVVVEQDSGYVRRP
jgi:MSHA pilin protein MshC